MFFFKRKKTKLSNNKKICAYCIHNSNSIQNSRVVRIVSIVYTIGVTSGRTRVRFFFKNAGLPHFPLEIKNRFYLLGYVLRIYPTYIYPTYISYVYVHFHSQNLNISPQNGIIYIGEKPYSYIYKETYP